MNPSSIHLFLSDKEIDPHPVDVALRSVLEHLNSSADAFFILEVEGGFFQGHQLEDKRLRLEYAELSEETGEHQQWSIREPLAAIDFCRMFVDVHAGGTGWRDSVEWDLMDFSVDEDEEVLLGGFEPREVQLVLDALHAEGVEVRMEHSDRGFDLIVTAGELDAANAIVQRTLRLEV